MGMSIFVDFCGGWYIDFVDVSIYNAVIGEKVLGHSRRAFSRWILFKSH